MKTHHTFDSVGRSQRGQTLVGLLVATVIVGISGAAVMSALGQFNSQANLLDVKTNGLALATEMADELSKLTTCAQAMKTNNLQQASDGTYYPIAMTVPSMPTVLIQGNNQVLDTYAIRVKSFFIQDLRDTGLKGPNNQELFVGSTILQFSPVNGGGMNLRDQPVNQLFLELNGSQVVSCSSNDDPITALAMACSRVSGTFDITHMSCDMSPLSNQIETQALAEVNAYLDHDYYNQVMTNAGQHIQTTATNTLNTGVATADRYTDGAESNLDGSIGTQASGANNFITAVNNALNQNAFDLWNGYNGVNAQTAAAQGVVNGANQLSNAADAASQNSLSLSSQATSNVTYANQVSNNANAQSQAANTYSGQASSTANSANAVTGQSYAVDNVANSYTNAANNASGAANNATNYANSVSSAANNASTSAYAVASAANDLTGASYNLVSSAYSYSDAGNSYYSGTVSNSDGANWWSGQALSRGYQSSNQVTYTSAPCVVGGPQCTAQN